MPVEGTYHRSEGHPGMTERNQDLMRADLVETIRIEIDGSIPLWQGHSKRLLNSARLLGRPVSPENLAVARADALARRAVGRATRWRLLLAPEGTLRSETTELPDTPRLVQVQLAGEHLESDWPWLRHKTTWRPLYQQATGWLAANPAVFDLLFLNERGELCEGSRTNVYVCDERGVWLTPPLSSGVLPGVYRQTLLESGQAREAVLTQHCLETAAAIRVSNALRGWLNAGLLTRAKIPNGNI